MDRRVFLSGAAGVGLSPLAARAGAPSRPDPSAAAKPEAVIRRYRALGKTGMKISDVSFGSSSMADPRLVRYAFERGVNFFDSAESYRGGGAEEAIGKALEGVRDRVYITSKTKAWDDESRADMMRALEGSLRRLRTDYVDVYFNHAVNDVERMQNQEWWEFTELAKRQGKIRFRGMSGHGSRLVPCLDYALDHDLVDVILCAFNFGQDPSFYEKVIRQFHFAALQPELPPVMEKAKTKQVGVVAMKTLMGARLNDLRAYESRGATYSQAAFSWVLSNPSVDALVISMTNTDEIDEFLRASGQRFDTALHLPLLERYAEGNGAGYCQHGCAVCAAACPVGVPIAEVLRTRMYALDYGRPDLARADYAALSGSSGGDAAQACLECAAQPCAGACPNGIPISTRTRASASLLGRLS